MTGARAWSDRLAEFVAGVPRRRHAADDIDLATRTVVDTVGVMLAGRRSEAYATLRRYAREAPDAAARHWVAGGPRVADPETAALVNATLAHALDYDDSVPGVGHPSGPVLTAALAAAGASSGRLAGRHLRDAVIAGFEVTVRVGRALGATHYYRGWHTTGTAGCFGAAAAASVVLGADAAQVTRAFGIAGSMATGLRISFGTLTKALHSGVAAQRGWMAAALAATGVTSAGEVFEGNGGFLELHGSHTRVPAEVDDWDGPLALQRPGNALKVYPCGYAVARPVEAAIRLAHDHDLTARDVARVRVAVPVGGTVPLLRGWPSSGLTSKFNVKYLVAAALLDRAVTLDTITDEAVTRADLREIGERISVVEEAALRPSDPTGVSSSPATGGAVEVRVWHVDGRLLTCRVEEPYGGPRRRLSWADIDEKFRGCARYGGYPAAAADAALTRLRHLDAEEDVLAVLGSLRAAGQ